MRYFYILFTILLFYNLSIAQWYQQSSGTVNSLNGVFFIDNTIGWVVGLNGSILKTTNGGNDWFQQNILNNDWLYSVHFFNANYGVAVGYTYNAGIIYRTTNSGNNWSRQLIDSLDYLLSVCLVDINNGYIAGDYRRVLKTTDGGISWDIKTLPYNGYEYQLNSVYFLDLNTGWVVGYPSPVWKTTDGGETWIQGGWDHWILGGGPRSVFFINASKGWLAGNNANICVSTDGGIIWKNTVIFPPLQAGDFNSIFFVNDSTGYVAGEGGTIFKSTDGGTTWSSQLSGVTQELHSLSFPDENFGWAVGENGIILHTTNGGTTFIEGTKFDNFLTEFMLGQNFPNPFNNSTIISYSVPKISLITIKIYDILGNEIETLVNDEKQIGTYELNWNASELKVSGVYFYQLKAGDFLETKKMILLK